MTERAASSGRHIKQLAVPVTAVATVVAAIFASAGPAAAVTALRGYACAYSSNVGFFGGAPTVRGCGQTIPPGTAKSSSPSVTLPAGGSTTAISANDPKGALAAYGPAVVFGGQEPADPNAPVPRSGKLHVSTTGTTKVVSVATAATVGPSPFYADFVSAKCTATATRQTFSVVLTNAFVVTSTDANGSPLTTVAVPSHPPVAYSVPFQVNSVGDHGVVVFNERTTNGDGSTTLNAVHEYLQGPTAVGDLVIGQVICGH
jgi:hypothetical protein